MFKKIKQFLFHNQETRQTVIKNTFWLGFGQIAGRLTRAFLIIAAARVLGAEGYGVFSYVVSLAALFTIFSDIGISSIVTRELSKNQERERHYLGTALSIKIVLITISVILIIVGAPFITRIPQAVPLIPIAAMLFAFDGLRAFSLAITRAKEKMQIEAGIEIFTNVAIVVFGITVLILAPSAKSLVISYSLGAGAGFLMAVLVLRKYFSQIWAFFDRAIVKEIFSNAWPFALAGFLGIFMINTDTIMLGWLRNAVDVGLYSAAQRPVQLLYAFPSFLAISLLPTLSRLAKEKDSEFKRVLERSLASISLIALPITAGGMVLARGIITLVFGQEFGAATTAFQILLLTVLLVFPGTLIGYAIFAYNEQKSIIKFLATAATGNVILNALLIPRYGITGAATATLIAQIAANGFSWYRLNKINPFNAVRHLPKIALFTLLMTGATLALNYAGVHLLLVAPLSALLYFGALYLFKDETLHYFFKRTAPNP